MSEPQIIARDPETLSLMAVSDMNEEGSFLEAVGLSFPAPYAGINLTCLFTLNGDTDKLNELRLALEKVLSIVGGENGSGT